MEHLSGLSAFIRTVELGSQAAAAADLGLSRMAVSRHIQRLETRLGVRLMHRSTRNQTLTEVGLIFFEQARSALAQLQQAEQQAIDLQTKLRGRLRVSAPVSFSMRKLSPALSEFSELHAGLEVDLVLSDRRVDIIEEGFDLALRIGDLASSSMISRLLSRFPIMVCASPRYLERKSVPLEPHDLLTHNCLRYSRSNQIHGWTLFARDGKRVVVPVRGNLDCNNGDALVAAAMHGQGVVLQPSFIVEEALADGRLVRLMPDHPVRHIELHAFFPPTPLMPSKLRVFLDFLVQYFGRTAVGDRMEKPAAGADSP